MQFITDSSQIPPEFPPRGFSWGFSNRFLQALFNGVLSEFLKGFFPESIQGCLPKYLKKLILKEFPWILEGYKEYLHGFLPEIYFNDFIIEMLKRFLPEFSNDSSQNSLINPVNPQGIQPDFFQGISPGIFPGILKSTSIPSSDCIRSSS